MGSRDRSLGDSVAILIQHIEGGIACIQRDVSDGRLTPELGQALIAHNEAELAQLRTLSPDAIFKDVMANHWDRKREEKNLYEPK